MSGIEAISDARTAPVSEDLTTENLNRAILRGNETMYRVDKKVAPSVVLKTGEWAVLQNDQTLARATATPNAASFLVFAGCERFDAAATGQATIIINSNIVVKTNIFDPGPSYSVGSPLTVKDLGGGESFLTLQSGVEPILARVLEVPAGGVLVYETVRG